MREHPEEPPDAGQPPPGTADAVQADQRHLRDLQRQRQARVAKVLVALVLAIILIIFIVTNSQSVAVNFVFVKRRPRLIWVMFGCAVFGGIIGYLIGRPGRTVRLHRPEEKQER